MKNGSRFVSNRWSATTVYTKFIMQKSVKIYFCIICLDLLHKIEKVTQVEGWDIESNVLISDVYPNYRCLSDVYIGLALYTPHVFWRIDLAATEIKFIKLSFSWFDNRMDWPVFSPITSQSFTNYLWIYESNLKCAYLASSTSWSSDEALQEILSANVANKRSSHGRTAWPQYIELVYPGHLDLASSCSAPLPITKVQFPVPRASLFQERLISDSATLNITRSTWNLYSQYPVSRRSISLQ